jgi:hypothetical protein
MAAKKKAAKKKIDFLPDPEVEPGAELPPRYVADEEEPKAEAEPEAPPVKEAPPKPALSDAEIRRRKRRR